MGGGNGGHLAVSALTTEPTHQASLQDRLFLHLPQRHSSSPRRHPGSEYAVAFCHMTSH